MDWPEGLRGFDISHFQSAIQFHAMIDAGGKFCYCKVSQGDSEADPAFADFQARLASVDFPMGGYAFILPGIDGAAQANHFLSLYTPLAGDCLPMLDVETDGEEIEQTTLHCARAIKNGCGHWPILYVPRWLWLAKIKAAWPDEAPIWIPDYGNPPAFLAQSTSGRIRSMWAA